MPRTKMPRKKSSMVKKKEKSLMRQTSTSVESLVSSPSSVGEQSEDLAVLLNTTYESPTHFQKAFIAYYGKKVEVREKKYELIVEYTRNWFSNMLSKYPESYLNSNINSRCNEGDVQGFNDPIIKARPGRPSRLQSSRQEPTDFKKPRTPRRTSRKRSLSAPAPVAPLPPPPEFKTPLNSQRKQMAMIKTITPKVSNTPVSVMRRPQHGEVAFSTSGSPLLIGAVSREDIPTISVPMQDGRVFSILPDPGLPPPDLPDFDEDTKKYLKTLREHLAMLSSP